MGGPQILLLEFAIYVIKHSQLEWGICSIPHKPNYQASLLKEVAYHLGPALCIHLGCFKACLFGQMFRRKTHAHVLLRTPKSCPKPTLGANVNESGIKLHSQNYIQYLLLNQLAECHSVHYFLSLFHKPWFSKWFTQIWVRTIVFYQYGDVIISPPKKCILRWA